MDAYERFSEKVRHMTIDKTTDLPCPKCGGKLEYQDFPDETYMYDNTFERSETLVCQECFLNIEVVQVYKPIKCYVEKFEDWEEE